MGDPKGEQILDVTFNGLKGALNDRTALNESVEVAQRLDFLRTNLTGSGMQTFTLHMLL